MQGDRESQCYPIVTMCGPREDCEEWATRPPQEGWEKSVAVMGGHARGGGLQKLPSGKTSEGRMLLQAVVCGKTAKDEHYPKIAVCKKVLKGRK